MKKIIVLIILLLLTGCSNYRELEELAIVSGVGIDKDDENYIVSVQVLNPEQNSNQPANHDAPKFTVFTSKGATIESALRNIVLLSSKKIYGQHIQLYLFSEKVVNDNLEDALDISVRDTESRKEFFVAMTKDTSPEELLSVITPQDSINADYINKTIKENAEHSGNIIALFYNDLIASYLNKRTIIRMPVLTLSNIDESGESIDSIKDSNIDSLVHISGTVLVDESIIGYLSNIDGKYLSFVKKQIDQTIISDYCDTDDMFAVEINKIKTKLDFVDNTFNIKIETVAKLDEFNCNYSLTKNNNIDRLNKKLNKNIEDGIKKVFYENRSKNIDIFDIKDFIYKNNNKLYEKIKSNWNNFYQNIELKVTVDSDIDDIGNAIKVIRK